MEIALALVAALLFALGTVLQQKAGLDGPTDTDAPGGTSGLLLQMARRPVWLAGIAADALGFAAQAVALTIGRLAVVQPLLVSSVVFALPLGVKLTGQTVRRIDIVAALVVAAALAAFLLVADPSGGRDDAPFGEWMIACGACIGAAALLMLVARGAPAARRAAVVGAAAGILFGLTAALTKSVGDQFADSVLSIFTHWHLYGLIAVGYVALTLSQLSLQTGVLAPAIAACMAADPIASVVLGTTIMQESLDTSAVSIAVAVLALLAASGGLVVLARTQGEGAATKPAGGTQGMRAKAPAPQPAA